VKKWDTDEFDDAWDLYVAENREKWPDDDDSIKLNHPRPNATTILDHEQHFWMKFVSDGKLDHEKLEQAGYSEPQIPYITTEMIKLGWLPS
jgi:hypothetical protein